LLMIADVFNLVHLEDHFLAGVKDKLKSHPLIKDQDLEKLGDGIPLSEIETKLNQTVDILPLHVNKDKLIGYVLAGHEEDKNLSAQMILENLCNKASGIIAMRHVLNSFDVDPEEVD